MVSWRKGPSLRVANTPLAGTTQLILESVLGAAQEARAYNAVC